MITRKRSREGQLLEKLLEDAGIKLSSVATDIRGVSGRAMFQALAEGERDPRVLACLAQKRLRTSSPTGHGRLSLHGAPCRCYSRSVSPGRSPNPLHGIPRNRFYVQPLRGLPAQRDVTSADRHD